MIRFYSLFFITCSLLLTSAYAQDHSLSKKDTAEVRVINQRKFYVYKVEKGETLFSISTKFGVTEEEIKEFNAELKDGLKVKMKLWIPANSYRTKSKDKGEAELQSVVPENEIYHIAL